VTEKKGKSRRRGLSAYVPEGEQVLLSTRPHPLFIVLDVLGRLVFLAVVGSGGWWLASRSDVGINGLSVVLSVVAIGLIVLGWQTLEWACRLYVLTDRRVLRVSGVLRQYAVDVPLESVQHVVVHRSIRERLFNLGTLAFASAGTAWVEVVWLMVGRPQEKLTTVRRALSSNDENGRPRGKIPVIGLVGGIGAGKSEATRALAKRGCVIFDADAEAQTLLDRDDVRKQLVEWWGDGLLDANGKVDRAALAKIVFTDGPQRVRLEGLIHPLVREVMEEVLEKARQTGASGVVIDAPLLYEAGLDGVCDEIVFLDVPMEERIRRVRETRNWDEGELERREAVQMPVDEKRRAATKVIVNIDGREELAQRVTEVLAELRGESD
jgi:dephospho-CoA kinase